MINAVTLFIYIVMNTGGADGGVAIRTDQVSFDKLTTCEVAAAKLRTEAKLVTHGNYKVVATCLENTR